MTIFCSTLKTKIKNLMLRPTQIKNNSCITPLYKHGKKENLWDASGGGLGCKATATLEAPPAVGSGSRRQSHWKLSRRWARACYRIAFYTHALQPSHARKPPGYLDEKILTAGRKSHTPRQGTSSAALAPAPHPRRVLGLPTDLQSS